jgi:Tol biopolymer transport system component
MQKTTIGLAALVSVGLAAGACADGETEPRGVTAVTETPALLTDRPGAERNPRVSPDGTTLAFDAQDEDGTRIFLLDLGSSRLEAMSSGEGNDRRPAWSPDGRELAFVSDRDGATGLWTQPLGEGQARRLFSAGGASMSAPAWSPDGSRIAFSLLDPSRDGNVSYGRSTIVMVDVASGELTELTVGGDEWWPTWSADGAWLVYYLGLTDDLQAVRVSTGEIRPIGPGRFVGWRAAMSPTGSEMAFVSDMAGLGLFTADLATETPKPLLLAGEPDTPSFLPDGSGLVFSMDSTSTRIVRYRLADGHLADGQRDTLATRGFAPRPLRDGLAYLPHAPRGSRIALQREGIVDTLHLPVDYVADFAFSPDERHLVVAVPTPGDARHDLHLLTADGNPLRQLTHAGDVFRLQWCDDSETLAYSSRSDKASNTIRQTWLVDLSTGERDRVTTGLASNQWVTHCDRGGDRITFDLRLNGSGRHVAERAESGWDVEALGAGTNGRWSPDGRRLAFLARVDGRPDVFLREPDGTETRITNDDAVESELRWTRDGLSLVFAVRSPNRGIWLLPLDGGGDR